MNRMQVEYFDSHEQRGFRREETKGAWNNKHCKKTAASSWKMTWIRIQKDQKACCRLQGRALRVELAVRHTFRSCLAIFYLLRLKSECLRCLIEPDRLESAMTLKSHWEVVVLLLGVFLIPAAARCDQTIVIDFMGALLGIMHCRQTLYGAFVTMTEPLTVRSLEWLVFSRFFKHVLLFIHFPPFPSRKTGWRSESTQFVVRMGWIFKSPRELFWNWISKALPRHLRPMWTCGLCSHLLQLSPASSPGSLVHSFVFCWKQLRTKALNVGVLFLLLVVAGNLEIKFLTQLDSPWNTSDAIVTMNHQWRDCNIKIPMSHNVVQGTGGFQVS